MERGADETVYTVGGRGLDSELPKPAVHRILHGLPFLIVVQHMLAKPLRDLLAILNSHFPKRKKLRICLRWALMVRPFQSYWAWRSGSQKICWLTIQLVAPRSVHPTGVNNPPGQLLEGVCWGMVTLLYQLGQDPLSA